MAKVTNTTAEDVRTSVGSLYADLLNRRRVEREEKEEQKRVEEEQRRKEKDEAETKEDGTKMTKKEKRQAELDNWKEIVVGLTGDDLEYSSGSKKKKKKKYRKWIGEDDTNTVTTVKQKKVKKKNYNKEFEPELNMLRTMVSDQNKFTADLQKRFQNAAGPATKDAMPLNKTMVELAAAIMSGRTNALGMVREIGSLKKNIADLYMKQKKLDSELNGSSNSMDTADIGLMGSNIAASMFGSPFPVSAPIDTPVNMSAPIPAPVEPAAPTSYPSAPNVTDARATATNYTTPASPVAPAVQVQAFDPDTWDGPELSNSFTSYENVPHSIVVEKDNSSGAMRFVAIRDDNGEELHGCNIPTVDPSTLSVNEKDMTVKGQFDEVYQLRYVG